MMWIRNLEDKEIAENKAFLDSVIDKYRDLPKRIKIWILDRNHFFVQFFKVRSCCVCQFDNPDNAVFNVGDIIVSVKKVHGTKYYHFECAEKKNVI